MTDKRTLTFEETTNMKIDGIKELVSTLSTHYEMLSNPDEELIKFEGLKAMVEDFISWLEPMAEKPKMKRGTTSEQNRARMIPDIKLL